VTLITHSDLVTIGYICITLSIMCAYVGVCNL